VPDCVRRQQAFSSLLALADSPAPQVEAQDDPPAANEYPRSTVLRFKADHPWIRLHLTALSHF